jgi:transposase
MSPIFDAASARTGQPSISPEQLLKALLRMVLCSVQGERQCCEHLAYNVRFRWVFDLDMAQRTLDATRFSRNRERLLAHDAVVEHARETHLMSSEHVTVRSDRTRPTRPRRIRRHDSLGRGAKQRRNSGPWH